MRKIIKVLLGWPLYIYKIYALLAKSLPQIEGFESQLSLIRERQDSLIIENRGNSGVSLPKELRPIYPDQLTRLGPKSDGGYVLPESLLSSVEVLITYGISILKKHSNWDLFCDLRL